ncbi:MAG: hypothetical protein GX542_08275 [Rhodococcus sp.]|nr:hypothetical protein [Rhodococcus sp. (in: high G+C Gram-positive bacteria)]
MTCTRVVLAAKGLHLHAEGASVEQECPNILGEALRLAVIVGLADQRCVATDDVHTAEVRCG